MKTTDFIREQHACIAGAEWALSISEDMADVWDAMIEQKKHGWLMWTAARPGVFPDSTLRRLACRFVRETPLHDGRTVWDLLTDERSRMAAEVAERYVDGKATEDDLESAYAAANAAFAAARAADADYAAAYAASAAHAAAYAAYAAYAADAAAGAAAHAAAHATLAAAWSTRAAAAALTAAYAAHDAADADESAAEAAKAAQIKMIAALGNPFKKGADK